MITKIRNYFKRRDLKNKINYTCAQYYISLSAGNNLRAGRLKLIIDDYIRELGELS